MMNFLDLINDFVGYFNFRWEDDYDDVCGELCCMCVYVVGKA